MAEYVAPSVSVLGTVSELTQSTIYKNAGTGDVIVINGTPITIPGGSVTNVS